MKKKIERLIASILVWVMFLSCCPTNALAQLVAVNQTNTSGSISILKMVVVPETNTYTYTFKVGADTVSTQVFVEGEGVDNYILYEPATPTVGANQVFEGWYIGDEKLTFTNGQLAVTPTEDVTVNARIAT